MVLRNVQPAEILGRDFATVAQLIRAHAQLQPEKTAVIHEDRRIGFAALDRDRSRQVFVVLPDGLLDVYR